MVYKAIEFPEPLPPVSAAQLMQENEARVNHVSKGGSRRRRRGGGTMVLHETGNPQSDANALASAKMIKQMDQINAAQTKGGMRRRKKRRFKTRKYIKVGYVRKRR